MQLIWPAPGAADVDDAALIALHSPTERTQPLLRVNFVASADGAGTLAGKSARLSGPADTRIFGILRMLCDVLLVGAGTVRTEGYRDLRLDDRRRDWRLAHGLAAQPVLAIVSGRLDLDPGMPAFADAPVRPIVVTHGGAPAERRRALSTVADVVEAGGDALDPAAARAALADRGLPQILCEGGPTLLGALTAADAVDELCLTVAPMLAGAGAGRITAGPTSAPRSLALSHALTEGGSLFLRYARR